MRDDIKFFSHSNKGRTELNKAMKDLNITRGLCTIGKTRFATIVHAAVSLLQCMPAIYKLVEDNEIPTFKVNFIV